MSFMSNQSFVGVTMRRTVCVANKCPPDYHMTGEKYPSNKIITSRYTLLTFIPKNLFEQFRRIANFYFLCVAIIQFNIDTPVSPATSMMPLIFVVTVTAIKQAYEDWLRHKADRNANQMPVMIYRNGSLITLSSQDIRVGDIIMVKADEEVPCDLILLSSSDEDGRCQVTTANLDGETNLKIQECPDHTLQFKTEQSLSDLCAVIESGPPIPNLYVFNGKITVYKGQDRHILPLNSENLLLRGSTLKNTKFIFGCAIFTGPETKMVLNLKIVSNKFSTLERTLNRVLVVFLGIMLMQASISTALYFVYDKEHAWYIPHMVFIHKKKNAYGLEMFLSFIVLFNYIIPISLYVTLEMVKFIGAKFFMWDLNLYDEKFDEPAICNSSDLNEELGQVEFLFSDKTGTLTQNDMVFRQCSIYGIGYEEYRGDLRAVSGEHIENKKIEHFFTILALCNTVEIKYITNPEVENRNILNLDVEYAGSSPDEEALVEACAKFGVVLQEVIGNVCRIKTKLGIQSYKRLCTLEFTSERKRMSTIIEDENGNLTLYCKGADSAVLKLAKSHLKHQIGSQIDMYSLTGYRALAIAERKLTRHEYEEFKHRLNEARCLLQNREAAVSEVFESIEHDLDLVGATAVEDCLQEGVRDTIIALRAAGIKVWVLTGDHYGTALNISLACGHISRDMRKLEVLDKTDSEQCALALSHIKNRIEEEMLVNCSLIIDGISLGFAIEDHSELLASIVYQCVAVLCCRMSPLQKAEVVKLVKHSPEQPVTAAIGDGANDVSMIQEAHVGLGIIGREGRQAVRCSDFAFTQFRFLKRVLLVHGQYYYLRAAMLVQYFFYKNVAFIIPQFIYEFYNRFTPQPVYNAIFLMTYNIFFTSVPILVFGFTEKHLDENTLMNNPSLYKKLTKNNLLRPQQFLKWIFNGLWHCLVTFFGVRLMWGESPVLPDSGMVLGRYACGTTLIHMIIMIVNLKLMLHTKLWTPLFIGSIIFSMIGFMLFTIVFTTVYWAIDISVLFGVYVKALESGELLLGSVVFIVGGLLPDIVIIVLNNHHLSLRTMFINVYNQLCGRNRYYRFTFSKTIEQPNASQINIFQNALDYEAQRHHDG